MTYSSENSLNDKFLSSFEDAAALSENSQIKEYKLVLLSNVTLKNKVTIRAKIIEIK